MARPSAQLHKLDEQLFPVFGKLLEPYIDYEAYFPAELLRLFRLLKCGRNRVHVPLDAARYVVEVHSHAELVTVAENFDCIVHSCGYAWDRVRLVNMYYWHANGEHYAWRIDREEFALARDNSVEFKQNHVPHIDDTTFSDSLRSRELWLHSYPKYITLCSDKEFHDDWYQRYGVLWPYINVCQRHPGM